MGKPTDTKTHVINPKLTWDLLYTHKKVNPQIFFQKKNYFKKAIIICLFFFLYCFLKPLKLAWKWGDFNAFHWGSQTVVWGLHTFVWGSQIVVSSSNGPGSIRVWFGFLILKPNRIELNLNNVKKNQTKPYRLKVSNWTKPLLDGFKLNQTNLLKVKSNRTKLPIGLVWFSHRP
jgi:hypothetical protein